MPSASSLISPKEHYLARAQQQTDTDLPPWLHNQRKTAALQLRSLDFPSPREEAWKYTNVATLSKICYELPSVAPLTQEQTATFRAACFDPQSWNRLVFINGHFAPEFSRFETLPAADGFLGPLKQALQNADESRRMEPYLGQGITPDEHLFAALGSALWQDGFYLRLAPDKVLKNPVHVIHLGSTGSPVLPHPLWVSRHLIRLERGSKATVFETYLSLPSESGLTLACSEVQLDAGANLEHVKLQIEAPQTDHISSASACLGRDSQYQLLTLSAGSHLARQNLRVRLDAEGANAQIRGLDLLHGQQHADNHLLIDHAKPNGSSQQFFKGVLADSAHLVFTGRIHVHPDAQKTNAYQLNKHLLLSEKAGVDSRPQLEIFADDVRCTHGAAIGQLDDEMLFYLKSRGLPENIARKMLTLGFAHDVLENINDANMKARLETVLSDQLQKLTHDR